MAEATNNGTGTATAPAKPKAARTDDRPVSKKAIVRHKAAAPAHKAKSKGKAKGKGKGITKAGMSILSGRTGTVLKVAGGIATVAIVVNTGVRMYKGMKFWPALKSAVGAGPLEVE